MWREGSFHLREDPAKMKSGCVPQIQGAVPEKSPAGSRVPRPALSAARAPLPRPRSRRSAQLPPPGPRILPLSAAAPSGTSRQSVPPPGSGPWKPSPSSQRPTQSPTCADPRFLSRPPSP